MVQLQSPDLNSVPSNHVYLTSEDNSSHPLRTPEDEARQIESLENENADQTTTPVDKSWWEKWSRYSGYSQSNEMQLAIHEKPGPVKPGEPGQSVSISKAAYDRLVSWYSLLTDSVGAESTVKLDLLYNFRGYHRRSVKNISRETPIGEVVSVVKKENSFRGGDWYLYDPKKKVRYEADDQRTLTELEIENGSMLCPLQVIEQSRKAGKIGLMNIGNTCYMNSSLQCLMHTPELMDYFLTEKYVEDISRGNPDGCEGKFAENFYKLMQRIWAAEHENLDPYSFWMILSKYYPLFAEKDQHDTAELAETVLDGLMEDCNRAAIPKPYFPEIEEHIEMSDSEMAELYWSYHKGRSSSYITDKFHGQYRILTRCPSCGFQSRKFDSFTVLHLGLPQPKRRLIVFTLIEVCGDQVPKKYAIELSSDLLVRDLYIEAAKLLKRNDSEPWNHLCFVLNRSTILFLQLDDPVARISDHDRVLLYSYKGTDYGPSSGGHKTCFIHQKMVRVTYTVYCTSWGSREEKQEFGHPLVLWLPHEDVTLSKKRTVIQGILEHSLRPYKRVHMGILTEQDESKDINMYYDANQGHLDRDYASQEGSTHAQQSSHTPQSVRSNLDDQEGNVSDFEDNPVPDTEDHMSTEPPHDRSEEVDSSQIHNADDEDFDPNLRNLFDVTPDPIAHPVQSNSSSTLRFGEGSPSDSVKLHLSEAYHLSECPMKSRVEQATTIAVDWSSNADTYYDLRALEYPETDPSAYGVEARRNEVAEPVSIYDCLTHEFSPHPCALDGDNLWKCGGCEEMVNGVKSMRLWKTADILLIGLKRFDYCEANERLIKLNQKVDFPLEGLDLSQYYSPAPTENAIYDLYGVCHHHGHGPKVGHYTSCVKSPGGKWHKFNDGWCTEVREDAVVNQDAYLLFYRRRGLAAPIEEGILAEFLKKEQQTAEDQAVKDYEARLVGTSDSDGTTCNGGFGRYGKQSESYFRAENGSSSSNEMNNENDYTGISSHGQGSSSSLCLGSSSRRTYYGPENAPEFKTKADKSGWPSENDPVAVAKWGSPSGLNESPTSNSAAEQNKETAIVRYTGADNLSQKVWTVNHREGTLTHSLLSNNGGCKDVFLSDDASGEIKSGTENYDSTDFNSFGDN